LQLDTQSGQVLLVWWEWFPEGPQGVNMPSIYKISLLQEVSSADLMILVNLGDTFFTNLTATSTTTAI
jgi:hypothetical protein